MFILLCPPESELMGRLQVQFGRYTSLAANDPLATVLTNNHFEPEAYGNTTIQQISKFFRPVSCNATTKKEYGDIGYQTNSSRIQQFINILEGLHPDTREYKDLTPLECAKLYNTDFASNHSNLFLVTTHRSNTTHNKTILDMIRIRSNKTSLSSWMCDYDNYASLSPRCNTSEPTANLTNGLPWRLKLTTGEEVEVSKCMSEMTREVQGTVLTRDHDRRYRVQSCQSLLYGHRSFQVPGAHSGYLG